MNKQDEEKAKEIAASQKLGYTVRYSGYTYTEYSEEECYKSAMEMAAWKEQQMIEWLDKNAWKYARDHQEVNTDKMIEDFKKAMEEDEQ